MMETADRDARVYSLLCRFEMLREQGAPVSIGELCRDQPELLDEVKQRLKAMQSASSFGDRLPAQWWHDLNQLTPTHTWRQVPKAAAPESAFVGTERFEVLRPIGRGGMGVVYAAHDKRWNEDVALKTLARTDVAALIYLKREFRTLAGLYHPNLIQLYELLQNENTWFFTMELLEGTNFLDYVRPGRRVVDFERLKRALAQIVHGLLALHDVGIIHRDIKPSNVLVTPDERLVLLDFGLALDMARFGTGAGLAPYLIGTPNYIAPEMVRLQPASPACDWYALGVMLFEALTGRLIFTGSCEQILKQKLLTDPHEFVQGLPEEWRQLVKRLLSRDPAERGSGREIFADYRFVAQGSSLQRKVLTPPFVGRQQVLSELTDALTQVRAGRTVLRILEGDSGIGKTAILQQFLRSAATEEALVLVGRCHEREAVPFNAFDEIAEGLSRWFESLPAEERSRLLSGECQALCRAFPSFYRLMNIDPVLLDRNQQAVDRAEQQPRLFRVFRELLRRIGASKLVILCIDDLQWGDSDSAAMLADLLCVLEPPRLLFIGCCRREALTNSALLQQLQTVRLPAGREIDLAYLPVEPLPVEEAKSLAAAVLGGEASEVVDQIARVSSGHPYLLCQIAQQEHVATASVDRALANLDDLVWSDLTRLDRPYRRLIELVAVASQPVQQGILHHAAEWAGEGWQKAMKRLHAKRLLQSSGFVEGQKVVAFHDRIREVILQRMPPEELRRTHLRLAEAYECHEKTDVDALAMHYEGAGLSERARPFALQAAEQAFAMSAFDRSARSYESYLRLGSLPEEEERRVRVRFAQALAGAGKGALAAQQFLLAADPADPEGAIELKMRACVHLSVSGRMDEAVQKFVEVFETAGLPLPPGMKKLQATHAQVPRQVIPLSPARRALVYWLAVSVVNFWDLEDAQQLGSCFDAEARACGESRLHALAIGISEAHKAVHVRTRPSASRSLDEAYRVAGPDPGPHVLGWLHSMEGSLKLLDGQWDDAVAALDSGDALWARCADALQGQSWNWFYQMIALFHRGRLAEIGRRLWPILKNARQRGDAFVCGTAPVCYGVMPWLLLDDPAAARQTLASARCHFRDSRPAFIDFFDIVARVLVELYDQPSTAAWEIIQGKRSFLEAIANANLAIDVLALEVEGQALLAAWHAGHKVQNFEAAARVIINRLRANALPFAGPLAELFHAGVNLALGERSRACELYAAATQNLEAMHMDAYAAAARRVHGLLLGGDEGAACVAEAEEWMRTQGACKPDRVAAMLAPSTHLISSK